MSSISPTLDGFRAAFRWPSLTLAEIAWRWIVGAVAVTLFLFTFIEFIETLTVTKGDAAFLRTRQPLLVGKALTHILRGSLGRAALSVWLALLALSMLWIFTASLGRAATVRALLDYFRASAADNSLTLPKRPAFFTSLLGLQFLRAATALAGMAALVGAAIVCSMFSPAENPRHGLVVLLFLPLAGLICVSWFELNWLLSLACIFVVRDNEDAWYGIAEAVALCRERTGSLFAVGIWNAVVHFVVFVSALSCGSLLLVLIHIAPARAVRLGVILVTLGYFAVADWLYIARLGGYICIAEMPEALASSPALPVLPIAGQHQSQSASTHTAIDRDERILSDLSDMAVETQNLQPF